MVYLLHYLPGVGEGDVVQPEDLGVLAQKQELVLHDLDPADEGADLEGRGAVERDVRPRHRRHVLRRGLRQIVDSAYNLTLELETKVIRRYANIS